MNRLYVSTPTFFPKHPIPVYLPPNKSILNRLLVLHARTQIKPTIQWPPHWDLRQATDTAELARGLEALALGSSKIHVEDGGTTFRFLLAGAARLTGTTTITTGYRLSQRPHEPLVRTLEHLGAKISRPTPNPWIVHGGWDGRGLVSLPLDVSSQFATSLLLWGEEGLQIQTQGMKAGYFEMTIKLLSACPGFNLEHTPGLVAIKKASLDDLAIWLQNVETSPPADASCWLNYLVFEHLLQRQFATLSSLWSYPTIPHHHAWFDWQPDVQASNWISEFKSGQSLNLDIRDCPDSFAPLACLALGFPRSHTIKVPASLRLKESNRIEDFVEFLSTAGFLITHDNGRGSFVVDGPQVAASREPTDLDPHHDHRFAMIVPILAILGGNYNLLNWHCVSKSAQDYFVPYRQLGMIKM